MIMEYQKTTNLLDNTSSQPTKFRTTNWVEINDKSRATYNTNSQIKIKTSMLRSILCDYSDAYTLVSGTITVSALATGGGNNDIQVYLKNFASFTSFTSEINYTQIDNTKDINVVIPMYNLIEYRDNYSKTSGNLWQYYRDEPAWDDDGALVKCFW